MTLSFIQHLLESTEYTNEQTYMSPEDKQQLIKLLYAAFITHTNVVQSEPGDVEKLDFRGILDTVEKVVGELPEGETYNPANARLR